MDFTMKNLVSINSISLAKYTAGVASLLLLAACASTSEKAPSNKFDLLNWSLSVPIDESGNGKADNIKEKQLNAGYTHPDFFYLSDDGGMVFKAPIQGAKTSKNTTYTRTELRSMIRRGDTSYTTKGVSGNNWVLSTAPAADQAAAGGIDGTMEATLAVNYVTSIGVNYQLGRVIIGQIHANHNEPVRLYYRKLHGNSKGSIYYSHEATNNKEIWVEMIGSKSNSVSDPVDGIALDEKFSYRIEVVGNTLTVTIMRPGKPDVVRSTDMSKSGYDKGGQYLYFKAGVYNQYKSSYPEDYVQATFYKLDVKYK
jgi:poly(beta-D-mannuronate) lyase